MCAFLDAAGNIHSKQALENTFDRKADSVTRRIIHAHTATGLTSRVSIPSRSISLEDEMHPRIENRFGT